MDKKVGVYTYVAQWPIYSLAWSMRLDKGSRLAVGSSLEDYTNKVELLHFNPDSGDFSTDSRLVLHHPYAPSHLMFFPSDDTSHPDLLATSGDFLRLWHLHPDRVDLKSLLNSNKASEFNSPITSFDWAPFDLRRVAASSVDTTCTVWDVETEAVDTQLVAHDKEVYDISWGGVGVFASVSGDGSVRVFDLRDKERSTIIYENVPPETPLLRLEWNKSDPRFIAAVGMDSEKVVVLDIRFPTTPLMELRRHRGSVNAVSWAPQFGRQLCSVGDDYRALIWEVVGAGLRAEAGDGEVEPVMWYGAASEINQVRWSPVELDLIAIAFSNKLQLLRV
ncbi:WD repeat-containing protein LWD1-like [Malania oleifera]|uniref:WD repeat-containing protein LWD1-like n=1 Tax=Malania oleifera TaxID=397392 RepID=UPI0025ADEF1E|nr:WD repeat-containing protein LWD1-like [Malania oleifera]XP_057968346.1 WD repeat-containing protein LWD1-like [Malania oleifera]